MKANADLRLFAKRQGVKQYEIADALGMTETGLCVKLRKELDPGEKDRVVAAILAIRKKKSPC